MADATAVTPPAGCKNVRRLKGDGDIGDLSPSPHSWHLQQHAEAAGIVGPVV